MLVQGKHFRTIWLKDGDDKTIQVIDQRFLPHKFVTEDLKSVTEVIHAIKDMHVRGAGLIGVAAAYGMYLATLEIAEKANFEEYIAKMARELKSARPTAVNLEWAVNRQLTAIGKGKTVSEKIYQAKMTAA